MTTSAATITPCKMPFESCMNGVLPLNLHHDRRITRSRGYAYNKSRVPPETRPQQEESRSARRVRPCVRLRHDCPRYSVPALSGLLRDAAAVGKRAYNLRMTLRAVLAIALVFAILS